MDEKKRPIELLTTHTANGAHATEEIGLRPTEEFGPEPILSAEHLPAFQGTHGNYDLGAEIARGGMGRIAEARDRRQDRPVALKFLLRPDAVSAKRFAREAWITGRLQHPSIIPLYESGRWETGEPFFAMKLVRGASLAEVLPTKGTYEERLALLPHLIALTEALAYAHTEGVVHRDLKPSNVLVGQFGETVVIDWGLAKLLSDAADGPAPELVADEPAASASLTAEGLVIGTPSYMPPEQARGAQVDARADVYSLGACLYHALSGAPPYGDTSGGRETVVKLLEGPPAPLAMLARETAPDLAAIVAKAMAREAKDRYPTANEMAEDLRRFAAGRLVSAHAYSLRELVKRWVAKRKGLVAVAAAALVAITVLAGISVRRITRERDAANKARGDAERQRAIAISRKDAADLLIDSLVGDFRQKLVPIGRLDVMSALGEKVLDYYRSVPIGDDGDAAALARRAKAIGTLAGVSDIRRDTDPAIRGYEAAISLCERAIALQAGETDGRRLRAWYLYRIGLQEVNRDNVDAGLAYFDRSLVAFSEIERLLSEPSALVDIKGRHALVFASQGTALLYRGDLERAESVLTSEMEREELDPSSATTASTSPSWAGLYRLRVRISLGDLSGAQADAQGTFDARSKWAATHPDDRNIAGDRLDAREGLMLGADHTGRYEQVILGLQSMIEGYSSLLKSDPEQLNWLSQRGDDYAHLCDIRRRLSDLESGQDVCASGVRDADEAARKAPSPRLKDELAVAINAAAAMRLAQKDAPGALREFTRSGELLNSAAGLRHSMNHDDPLVDALLGIARSELALGDLDTALRDATNARDVIRTYVSHSPHNVPRLDRACVGDLLLGDTNLARHDVQAARDAYESARAGCVPLLERSPDDASARHHCAEADAKLAAQTADPDAAKRLRAHAKELIAPLDRRLIKAATSELPGLAP